MLAAFSAVNLPAQEWTLDSDGEYVCNAGAPVRSILAFDWEGRNAAPVNGWQAEQSAHLKTPTGPLLEGFTRFGPVHRRVTVQGDESSNENDELVHQQHATHDVLVEETLERLKWLDESLLMTKYRSDWEDRHQALKERRFNNLHGPISLSAVENPHIGGVILDIMGPSSLSGECM